jgi:hypothetical protein
MKKFSFAFAILIALITTRAAFAHRPIFVDPASNTTRETAVKISDYQISWAIYAQLAQPGEINYYTFEGKRGEPVLIGVTLPKTEEATQFGIDVALIGNGFENPSKTSLALKSNESAIVASDPGHDSEAVFREPLTQTAYWVRQEMRVMLPSDGPYTIAVYNSENKTGKYVLAVGEREEWSVSDVPAFPNIWLQVRQFFGDVDLNTISTVVVIALGALIMGGLYYFVRG